MSENITHPLIVKSKGAHEVARRVPRLEIVAVVLILALSLGLRLVNLNAFIASDELRWTCRSISFRQALTHGKWSDTFRVGHPGVLTTWLGALFIPSAGADIQEACRVTEDLLEIPLVGETPEEQTEHLADLGRFLFQGRVGVALATWLCIVAIYPLIRLLWGAKVALLGLVLIALAPFFLAHSRFLHIDAVLTGVMTLSVLCLLVSFQRPESGAWSPVFLGLSGAAGGLAILQKSPAVFLAPFVALVLAADVLRQGIRRETLLRAARAMVVWGLAAAIIYAALWPAMWSGPVDTLRRVWGKAAGYAEEGHTLGSYFLGQPVHDPGWLFYPVATLFRLSPLTIIGLVAGIVWLARRGSRFEHRLGVGVLLLYGMLFGAFMSLGAKKFDRYLLPVYPALEIVAAVGLLWLAEVVWKRGGAEKLRHRSFTWLASFLIVVILQIALVLPHCPYYLTYYNPLLGGLRQAEKIMMVGWGEGIDQAAAYLNAKPDARQLLVTSPVVSQFAPMFHGETRPTIRYSVWESDYVMFYLSHVQRERYESLMAEYFFNPEAKPEYVVALHGVDYVWIYPNTHHVEPMGYLEERSQVTKGECLLVDGNSLFARHYQGELPVYRFYAQWNAPDESYTYWSVEQVAKLLDDVSSDCQRVWYARYPGSEENKYLDLLGRWSVLLEQEAFPYMEITLHRFVEPEAALRPLNLRFGDLQLRGYGITDPPPTWGLDGGVVLEWKALQPLEEDYSTFIHLYDSHGQRIAQGDALITDLALRPISSWEPGSPSWSLYHLPIPPGTPPGQYELEVGVYSYETGKRLPLLNAGGETQDTVARLVVEVGVPRQAPRVADLNIPHPLEQNLIPQLGLLGYSVEEEALLAGQAISLRLFWQALGGMEEAYHLQLGLRDPDGALYAQKNFTLVSTGYPTTQWRPGELLHDRYDLPTDEAMPTGEVIVEVNLLDEAGRPVLARPVELTGFWVQSTRLSFDVPATIGERYEVNLGDEITLLGYDLDADPVRPGGNVRVTLYWQAQREMETSYKVFVHVYDGEGNIVAQRDWLPGLGVKPTVEWKAGEVVADRHIVPVDEGVVAGEYTVAVGLYNEGNGERLAAFGPDGERLDQDRIFLGQVEIRP
ncbi:MAG: glycosyltransferase family 39 protein [Anaerolineae bacterium]|nr:glycosyltransferase family 39 protein [Anaerolineae bacterium]